MDQVWRKVLEPIAMNMLFRIYKLEQKRPYDRFTDMTARNCRKR